MRTVAIVVAAVPWLAAAYVTIRHEGLWAASRVMGMVTAVLLFVVFGCVAVDRSL